MKSFKLGACKASLLALVLLLLLPLHSSSSVGASTQSEASGVGRATATSDSGSNVGATVKCSELEGPEGDKNKEEGRNLGEEARHPGIPRGTTFTIIEHDTRNSTASAADNEDNGAAEGGNGGIQVEDGTSGTSEPSVEEAEGGILLNNTLEPGNATTLPPALPSIEPHTIEDTDALTIHPTNFQQGTPFEFAHIYFLGGNCGNEFDWYRNFVQAGMETLDYKPEILCPPGWNSTDPPSLVWWTREFHLVALKMVEEMAGDKLNETLVITVGVGLELDWTPVADLLRKGMAFFHAKEDPLERRGFDLAAHGFTDLNDILYLYFQWDEYKVAESNGKELCRLKGAKSPLKIAKIDSSGRESSPQTYRVNLALEAFRKACPETEVQMLWSLYDNVSRAEMESTLLFNPIPDVVMTVSDLIAEKILNVSKQVLTNSEYTGLTTTGWDNLYPDLLRTQKLLITVDQLVHYPNIGIWRAISTIVRNVQRGGMNSTRAIQQAVGLGDSTTVKAEALTVSGDRAGYLISNLLAGYDPNFPPYELVRVSTGLFGVTITEMDPFEGKFEAVLWLRMSWHDPRLGWHPIVYDDELPIDPQQIWTPRLYFGNAFDQNELYTAPAMLTDDGTVIMETNINAQFLCSTTEALTAFPFDKYQCSIDLGAPKGVALDQSFGFHVIESDPHYETSTSLHPPAEEGNDEEDNEDDQPRHMVHFVLIFERRPFTTYMRLILPAILINMIGFMAFWIPELPESVALGITSLLCALAFRETVEMPDTAGLTWTEVFMMINISYLAAVMLITWFSYSSSTRLGAYLNKLCLPCHPKKVAKDAQAISSNVIHKNSGHLDDKAAEALRLEGTLEQLRQEMEFSNAHDEVELEVNGDRKRVRESYKNRRESSRMRDGVRRRIVEEEVLRFSDEGEEEEIVVEPEIDLEKQNSGGTGWDSYRSSRSNNSRKAREMYQGAKTRGRDELGVSSMHKSLAGMDTTHARQRTSFFDDDDDDGPLGASFAGGIGISLANLMAPLRKHREKAKEKEEAKAKVKLANGFDMEKDRSHANVDWIGRWFVVPSYFVVMATLLFGGWGFKS